MGMPALLADGRSAVDAALEADARASAGGYNDDFDDFAARMLGMITRLIQRVPMPMMSIELRRD